jgi:serine/threonine protein kinase
LYLILEFVPQGDLGAFISQHGQLPELTVKSVAKQLLSALDHLHQLGITHRDIKPDNILIESKFPFFVKLTDFGLSKMVEDDDTFLRTFCGTLLYCAPEVYSEYREYNLDGLRTYRNREKKKLPPQKYGQAVDLWSLAAVLFYTLTGVPPFPAQQGTSYQELLHKIMTEPLDIRPLEHAGVSSDGIEFIRAMLNIRPECRATIQQLEASTWLTGKSSRSLADDSDSDEIDLVAAADNLIEQSASQLSIHDNDPEINDSVDVDSLIGLLPSQPSSNREIPSSFPSVDSSSSESYAYMRNPPSKPRLFGEVDGSAIGSSGVIPHNHLNLNYSQSAEYDGYETESQVDPVDQYLYTNSMPEHDVLHSGGNTISQEASTAPAALYNYQFQPAEGKGPATAPSLLGAESMVGNMVMNSPSPVPSAPSHPSTPVSTATKAGVPFGNASMIDDGNFLTSRRRSRDDSDEDSDAENRRPTAKRNKSTQHALNSSTFSPGKGARAQSEPAFQPGAAIELLMKRDERSLTDIVGSQAEVQANSQVDSLTMSAIEAFAADNHIIVNPATTALDWSALQPRAATYARSAAPTFQAPLPILARFTSTANSALHGITVNITSSVTTWGRGSSNLIVYPNPDEAKIPRYAFKLIIWEPSMSASRPLSSYKELRFWISTKATCGIKVNGLHLQSSNSNPRSVSNHWGELRHDDEITVWDSDKDPEIFTRLKFECFMGICKTLRPEGVDFTVLKESIYTESMDAFCLEVENEKLARRAVEEESASSGPPTS